MEIELDAKVRTSDGHDAGKLRRVLVDPATLRITGFVVSTGGLLGREVIVGEHDFVEGREGELMLRLSKAELAQQPTFDEAGFTAPPAGLAATMGYGFASNAYLVPVVAGDEPVTESSRPTIKKGDVVKDRDGDVVGVVEEVRFDEKTAQLSGFVVKAGAGRRLVGGGETAEISADDVLRIFEGEVRVGVDREEIVPSERESGTREG